MLPITEFDQFLKSELHLLTADSPKQLRKAMLYGVFPGGGRVRPKLAFGILDAMNKPMDEAVLGVSMAVELIHCASLVHDDMPCFDDAESRRGKPSVHRKFGENIALLVGDALIVGAFASVAKYCRHRPELVAPLIQLLSDAVGASRGIIAGQAFESEPYTDVEKIHLLKTGALFEGIATMTATVADADPAPWRKIGRKLGMAYQLADDIYDVAGVDADMGKPIHQDRKNQRPNAVTKENIASAAMRLDSILASAIEDIPEGPKKSRLALMLAELGHRLCPHALVPRPRSFVPQAGLSVQMGVA